MLTWVASPLFNFLLQFNRFGRLALTREERIQSTCIGVCCVLAVAFMIAYFASESDLAFVGMVYFGFLLFPLVVTFNRPAGRPRTIMILVTLAIAALGIPSFSLLLLGSASPFGNVDRAIQTFQYFVFAAVASSWVPAMLAARPGRAF